MLNLICLISHNDAKTTTKNLVGFNDTKSLRSVAARGVRCVVVGEYARHNKLNLTLGSVYTALMPCLPFNRLL
jgi:hypothetical protein